MLREIVKKFDIFGSKVPTFNIDGEDDVKTVTGGLLSLIIMMLTGIFGILKMQHLLERMHPEIHNNTVPLSFDDDYSLESDDFMVAFALKDKHSDLLKLDSRYVKWIATAWTKK